MDEKFSGPRPEGWEAVFHPSIWRPLAKALGQLGATIDFKEGLIQWKGLWIWESREIPPRA